MQLAVSPRRVESPQYRAPGATGWTNVSWDFVLGKIAQNIKASRDATFVTTDGNGNTVNRCEGIAFAGGAAFSSEEGYFATKLMRGLGLVQPRTTGQGLTRPHGGQFGRHIRKGSDDKPLARHQEH